MIALLARLLGLSNLAATFGAGMAVLAALAAAWGLHEWHAGSVIAEARAAATAAERRLWEVAAAKERVRRDTANAEAEARGAIEAARLRAERDDLAISLEKLSHDAGQDPDGAQRGLSAGGVRRVDAIR